MSSERVLVTGASGFLGSHLVEALVRQGAQVCALIRAASDRGKGNLDLLPTEIRGSLEVHSADLRDTYAVQVALAGVDTVYHLGAINSNPYSLLHPDETIAINVLGTLNVLQAMREHNTRRGVIVSTSEVYGTAQYVPIDEKHPLHPPSPYSASKVSAEALSTSFYRAYSTPVVVIRPFNVYGPRQSARAVIPTIISQTLGKDIVSLGALHTVRDYTYVTDTVRGLMMAACSDAALGQTINIGSGESLTISDIVNKVIALTGRGVTISAHEGARLRSEGSEVLRLACDNRLARSLLGWQPQVKIDEGLQITIEWIAKYLEHFDLDVFSV